VRRCTVLVAMWRYEFCQVFCRGIRAKLRCSLIPFARLGNIRLNSDSAEPPDRNGSNVSPSEGAAAGREKAKWCCSPVNRGSASLD
jgi:hypothetical protein